MPDVAADPQRFRVLGWICLAELGALSLWFSASAVIPALTTAWMSPAAQAWLSMSVTLGFVVGTALSAVLTLADYVGARRLFAISAVTGALANAGLLLWIESFPAVIVSRFVTGIAMAGVYPPGIKLVASWFLRDRGLAVGSLVGALTLGTAAPYAVRVLGGVAWQPVIVITSLAALGAAVVVLACVTDGPHLEPRAPFDPGAVGRLIRTRSVMLANLGYFGHMWELYAMWTWIALYFAQAFSRAGLDAPVTRASVTAASVIGIGALGCIAAGQLADRIGRTATTALAMLGSGACAAAIGLAFDHPALLVAIALVWGVTVVADSAQFSAAISELAPSAYVGTALSLQTCVGFLITLVSVRLHPVAVEAGGWAWSFAFLAPGPLLGALAMWMLRRLPDSMKLAHGKR